MAECRAGAGGRDDRSLKRRWKAHGVLSSAFVRLAEEVKRDLQEIKLNLRVNTANRRPRGASDCGRKEQARKCNRPNWKIADSDEYMRNVRTEHRRRPNRPFWEFAGSVDELRYVSFDEFSETKVDWENWVDARQRQTVRPGRNNRSEMEDRRRLMARQHKYESIGIYQRTQVIPTRRNGFEVEMGQPIRDDVRRNGVDAEIELPIREEIRRYGFHIERGRPIRDDGGRNPQDVDFGRPNREEVPDMLASLIYSESSKTNQDREIVKAVHPESQHNTELLVSEEKSSEDIDSPFGQADVDLPEEEMQIMAHLARECLQWDPDSRPTMTEIVQILTTIAPETHQRRHFHENFHMGLSWRSIKSITALEKPQHCSSTTVDEVELTQSISGRAQDQSSLTEHNQENLERVHLNLSLPSTVDQSLCEKKRRNEEVAYSAEYMHELVFLASAIQNIESSEEDVDLTEPRFESFL